MEGALTDSSELRVRRRNASHLEEAQEWLVASRIQYKLERVGLVCDPVEDI